MDQERQKNNNKYKKKMDKNYLIFKINRLGTERLTKPTFGMYFLQIRNGQLSGFHNVIS